MAKLSYTAIMSLDGYIADANGNFDWAMPTQEWHAFINDLERPVGTYLYGRRLYEVMLYWETVPISGGDVDDVERDYAQVWRAAEKVVYSTTLGTTSSERTRIEPTFDADTVRQLKAAAGSPLAIGGAELAGQALRADLVDECHFFVVPFVIGEGTRALPRDTRVRLTLVDERRFSDGTVYLHYGVELPRREG